MPAASQPSERIGIIATIDPQTISNTELFTDVVDMSKWHEVMAIVQWGNMASEALDFRAVSTASDGTGATAITGKAITQVAAHASNNDNTQHIINLKSQEIASGTVRYVKFGAVTGGATGGPANVIVLGLVPRHGPVTDNDLSTVTSIIS